MKNQDLNSFKPLSEEEEKHVVGGLPSDGNQCGPLLQKMQSVEIQIQNDSAQGIVAPITLVQELNTLKLQYQQCMSGNAPN